MSTRYLLVLAACALGVAAGRGADSAPRFTVHEWGTFTTVHAPDGSLLPGLEREEERLPNFVHSHAGFAPADKGWARPVANVTVKMETPVLYVYAPQPFRLRIGVRFRGGSFSQWYPQRAGGEALPSPALAASAPPVDFAAGFEGSANWDLDVLPPETQLKARPDWETPQWPRARIGAANVLAGPDGEREGFVFYRGIGNFEPPLHLSFEEDGALRLENRGAEPLPFVWIYDHRSHAGGRFDWSGSLAGGETRRVGLAKVDPAADQSGILRAPLIKAGLSPEEVGAMLATWKESYFEREGLRVFWIVPRAFTDRVLPLQFDPAPSALERVLVGRSEVVTPELASEIAQAFRADGGARWRDDRYCGAFRALAEKRGVVSRGAATTVLPP